MYLVSSGMEGSLANTKPQEGEVSSLFLPAFMRRSKNSVLYIIPKINKGCENAMKPATSFSFHDP